MHSHPRASAGPKRSVGEKFLHACLYAQRRNYYMRVYTPRGEIITCVFILEEYKLERTKTKVRGIRVYTVCGHNTYKHAYLINIRARDQYRARVSTLFLIAPTHMCDPFGITQSHAYAINYARPRVIRGIYTLRVYSSRRFIPRRGIKISLGFSVPGPLKGARDFESSPW